MVISLQKCKTIGTSPPQFKEAFIKVGVPLLCTFGTVLHFLALELRNNPNIQGITVNKI